MIDIVPITITQFPSPVVCDKATFGTFTVVPGVGASGQVNVGVAVTNPDQTQRFNQLAGWTVALTPEQYAQWGTDDTYAENCVLANLGIQRA